MPANLPGHGVLRRGGGFASCGFDGFDEESAGVAFFVCGFQGGTEGGWWEVFRPGGVIEFRFDGVDATLDTEQGTPGLESFAGVGSIVQDRLQPWRGGRLNFTEARAARAARRMAKG